MATGILSLAVQGEGGAGTARRLYQLNLVLYGTLWVLYLLRLVRFPRLMLEDLRDHHRGPGFFTLTAGSGVLGVQALLIGGNLRIGLALWAVTLLSWLLFTWSIFALLSVRNHKPSLERGINGGWLLAVVATQSLAVLSALIAASMEWRQIEFNFLALSTWLWGGMLYTWIMVLIFYRYLFLPFSPEDLSPPYWINMGAMAISTLAGTLLVANAPEAPLLDSLLPFIKGFTILYWATGTWWIPMLVILGVWRHLLRRLPLRYDPLYWGLVFPLGMYSVCTRKLIEVIGLPFMLPLPEIFLVLAALAWLGTSGGLVHRIFREPVSSGHPES